MKVFILSPNFREEKKSVMNIRPRQPLSLATIASILRSQNHQIEFLDANALNCATAEIINKINESKSDFFITTSTPIDRWECPHSHLDNLFFIINSAEVKYKILTGAHGTVTPEWIFKKCNIDFVIRGEPELIIDDLIKKIVAGGDVLDIKGLSWKNKDGVVNNPSAPRIYDLDKLPVPAYDLLPMKKYNMAGFNQPFSIMMTSRGCPYSCTFCLKVMAPGKYIAQSPERVVKEIKYLIESFDVKAIYFQDWEFLILPDRVELIADLILKNKLVFSWGFNARADDIIRNNRLLSLLKQAGCKKINLGMESASEKILKNIEKKLTTKDLKEAIDILKDNNLDVGFYVLLNSPGEDKETIKETINFIENSHINVKYFSPTVPYPGTKLFDQLANQLPGVNLSWDNIENYTGRVATKMSPFWARFYLRHYKYKKKYGSFYFLKPKFISILIKKKL